MLKALYNFKATFAKTLSFQENDIFILHQVNTKQRNWWQVVNSMGQVGYVPSNYVTTIQVKDTLVVKSHYILLYVVSALLNFVFSAFLNSVYVFKVYYCILLDQGFL
jgi:hypothetical protein